MADLKHSLNDEPLSKKEHDLLGRSTFIERVCEAVRCSDPPKGLAVSGYWGSGKTSLLRAIEAELQDGGAHTSVTTVWFDAWKYQHEAEPVAALLQEIRGQLVSLDRMEGMKSRFGGALRKMAYIGVNTVLDNCSSLISTTTGVAGVNTNAIRTAGKEYDARNYLQSLTADKLRELLREAVNQILDISSKKARSGNKCLVILVDDLDRCEPVAAYRLLEGIKLYLSLDNCITLFGMDVRQLELMLPEAKKHSSTLRAAEYLEKLCQDVHSIPLPDRHQKAELLHGFLQRLECKDSEDKHKALLKDLAAEHDCLPANPRKIKALVNRLALMMRSLDIEVAGMPFGTSGEGNDEVKRQVGILLLVAILHTFHRTVYEAVEKNPDYIGSVVAFAKGVAGSETDPLYAPFREVKASQDANGPLPVNPSDSDVFRLHQLTDWMQGTKDAKDGREITGEDVGSWVRLSFPDT